jgi:hypothetical protein
VLKVRMKRSVLDRWLEALRSDDYLQTTDYLGRETDEGSRSHCCLGVLCDLAAKEGAVDLEVRTDGSGFKFLYYGDTVTLPPEPVEIWSGLHVSQTNLFAADADPTDFWIRLSGKNDGGVSFKNIANYIEKNVEAY